ncbi:hypothetical protein Bca4012_052309 [Brassica carinata]
MGFGCEAVSNLNTQEALALPEKEVIQPHLPVRLPCYDFTPVTSPAFGTPLLAVKVTTSGMASSHSVTGGVYKARERIHRRGILNALATALHGSIRTAPSIHRLRLGLLGYLIPFAPLAFVSQCQCRPSRVLSPLVFFPISTHFTAPPEIPSAPTVLKLGSFHRLSRVEPWDLTADLKSHLQTLYAQSFRITLASSVLPRLLAQS